MAGAAALALPAWLRPAAERTLAASRKGRFRRRLRIPPVLTGANLTIPIVARRVRIRPGRKTRMWTYGGTFPGPTIRRPAGEETRVTFVHRLPPKAGELSVHLHGGHQPSEHDGQPGGLTALKRSSLYCDISPGLSARESGSDVLISPGEARTYVYPGVEDGAPERAAFHWYHDHRLDNTSRNVWRGLAGMWITDEPEVEGLLNLPAGRRDIPLLIADRSLTPKNRLRNPFRSAGKPPFDHVKGRQMLVNGIVTPFAHVAAARHRLRLLNASSFRAYNLELEGLEMLQIASESGLMPRAVRRRRILLGPGERAEVIVDFARARGQRVRLRSVRRRGAPDKLGSRPLVGEIMEFRVGHRSRPDATATVGQLASRNPLRPLPEWVAQADLTPSHTWRIELGGGLRPRWLINGRTFDPGFVEESARPRIGEVVTWRLKNATAVAHLLHLHHTDWYMLRRNGKTPRAHERCLKETFFLDPGDEVIVAGKVSDHLGKYVVHCHMLDHEDHGLMSQFEVVEAPAP